MAKLNRVNPDQDEGLVVVAPPRRFKRKELVEFPEYDRERLNLDFDVNRYLKGRNDDVVPASIDLTNQYRYDPFKFIQNELNISTEKWHDDKPPVGWNGTYWPLWSKQREIVRALSKHKKVAVRSGHGLGKSFIAAICVLYLAYAYHALGITTAPTFRQVEKVLWGEIHYLYNNAGGQQRLGGILKKTSLELGDKWFVEGISVRDPKAAITGFHEENVFAVIDEAGGVNQEVFDALEGVLTSTNSFIVLIGNPIESGGPFEAAFHPRSDYHKIHLSCYDSPNVRHKRDVYPKLCGYKWPSEKAKQWGEDSNLYRVRVLGEFPTEGSDTLIPLKYIDIGLTEGPNMVRDEIVSFGLDVSRQGTDRSVIGVRYRSGRFDIIDVFEKRRETETAGRMVRVFEDMYDPDKQDFRPCINVDDIGLGGGVTDILHEQGMPVNGINSSEPPPEHIETDEELNPDKFLNRRAWTYWRLRKGLQDQTIGITDETLAHELSKIPLKFSSKGKIQIPDKDLIRKELKGKSPDYADCMMLAWAEDEFEGDSNIVRFI